MSTELIQSLVLQSERLAVTAKMEASSAACDRDEAVRKIVRRSAVLIRGAATLSKENNSVALAILARALVESWILLVWVGKSDENARITGQSANAAFAKAARINLEARKLRVFDRTTGADVTENFLTSHPFEKPTLPTVEAQAKDADVLDIYLVVYRFLSLEVHGHGIDENEDATSGENSVALMNLVGAFGNATGSVAVHWLVGRTRPDNEVLREMFGLNS